MNLEEFRKALSSNATEENVKLKEQLQNLQHSSHDVISKLESENEVLKENCRALCNRCFALTRGITCLYCGLNYPCPHRPSFEDQVAMIKEMRKGEKQNAED